MLRPLLAAIAALLALSASAHAAAPADRFNAPGQRHVNVCVPLAGPSALLRYSDGSATGFALDNQRTFDEDGRCPNFTVRLDLHELIPSPAGPMAFHRGGNGYVDDQNVKYGELATADVVGPLPAPVLSRGGRGAPCDVADPRVFEVDVNSIPAEMHYKRPQDVPSGSNNGASFLHYGDPGADQGSRDDIHYSYLLWSFPNVRGGGIVRTLLKQKQVVRLCDVDPIRMDSWDRAGNDNGDVEARYVRILAGSCPLYGWMVWSHDYAGDAPGPVAHARPATATPPAEPQPAADCPVQEDAVPPAVATGAATNVTETGATLAGTIDAAGVNGTYRFEWGYTSQYGNSTSEFALAPDISPKPFAFPITGLLPGTTYHYRLVAATTHGTTYGPDVAFTTPAPPPPPQTQPARAEPPPLPPPPAISSLRVSPSKFKRARTRSRHTTWIRWTTSADARVALVFERKTTGMRVAGACRPLPRGGLPRGARRCSIYEPVKGSLRQSVKSGKAAVRFGGWLGKRPLARGTYRVRAVAAGGDGRAGGARYAGFTVR